ncbi:MAG: thioredoxin family protein [Bacteroidota bacterium]
MKYTVLLFLALYMNVSFSQGISFESTSFQSALNKAKAENKMIFMFAYSTWSKPCKWMTNDVFTDERVGAYFNDKFINVKVDMERGEGIDLASNYDVNSYPTLLFINGDGELIHTSVGSRPVDDFLDLGLAALDPDRQLTTMNRRFDSGERNSEFLKLYTDALTSAGMKNFDEIAQLYMDTQSDWSTDDNMQFIFDYSKASLDSKLFQYTLRNEKAFITLVGQEKYDEKVKYAAEADRAKAGIARDDVEKLKDHYAKYFSTEIAHNLAMISYFNQIMYHPDPVRQEQFLVEVQLFLAGKPDVGARFYNAVAWRIYEISNDRILLTKAVEWAFLSMEDSRDSFNTDTMASLQYKLGNMDKAKMYAQESIELAKREGNDYRATEELLYKINLK